MYCGKNPNQPTNKQKTQPRPMNLFEISLGPVSPANATPESTCKHGRGQEEGEPEETPAWMRPGERAGAGSGAQEPSCSFSAPRPCVSDFGFATSSRGCVCANKVVRKVMGRVAWLIGHLCLSLSEPSGAVFLLLFWWGTGGSALLSGGLASLCLPWSCLLPLAIRDLHPRGFTCQQRPQHKAGRNSAEEGGKINILQKSRRLEQPGLGPGHPWV